MRLLPFLLLACGDPDPNPPVTTDRGAVPTASVATAPDAAPSWMAGGPGWRQIFQPVQHMPIHNVSIHLPQ